MTNDQVREYYEAQGCTVRITNGHVEYKRPGEETWREGRWVSEYRAIDGQIVLT